MHDLNIQNAQYYGAKKQMPVLIEEMAELTQAATKWIRIQENGLTVRKPLEDVMANMTEEIADVEIMLEQIKELLGISNKAIAEIKDEKIWRTYHYIEDTKAKEAAQ